MRKRLAEFSIVILILVALVAVVFGAIDASNTPTSYLPRGVNFAGKTPWMVNCTDNDAQGGETIKAAPGAGKHLWLQYIVINCNADEIVAISDGANTLLGPYSFDAAGGPFLVMDFGEEGIQLAANSALGFSTAGAATSVTITAKGYTN